jgi:hypothetical protein
MYTWKTITRVDTVCTMAIRVVEFSNRGYKIRKVFAKESTYSNEIIVL